MLIAKLDNDDDIPEEVAEFVTDAAATLISIMSVMPGASMPGFDLKTCTYRGLLTLIESYIQADAFVGDLTMHHYADNVLQSICSAMEAYLD